ncbi:serine protease Hayan-like isoform X2 [Bradysia coprophila]|uniref:serine protease Hayan-like isoform X2 n=1 Tax=Bradysia coprophila TaxID=38358 RepID=UPI00187D73AD|nr:serine protease Hayan-like isoform X2 [Bradysia coprophila]
MYSFLECAYLKRNVLNIERCFQCNTIKAKMLPQKNFHLCSDPTIVLGDLELFTEMDDAQSKTYKVINTFTHPDFNQGYAYADIKLYQLNESIKFNEYVRPACLSSNDLSVSEALTQITWGTTNIRKNRILHKINLNNISNISCKKAYKISKSHKNSVKDIETQSIFCAESKNGTRAKISGGGGSAVIRDNRSSLDEVIGLQSWSVVSVYVFVRVSSYIDWIESIVWSKHCISTTTQHTNEIQVMTVASTASTTHFYEFETRTFHRTSTSKHPATATHPPNEFETKTFPIKFIFIIVAISMTLLLCASVMYFLLFKSKASVNNVNFQV